MRACNSWLHICWNVEPVWQTSRHGTKSSRNPPDELNLPPLFLYDLQHRPLPVARRGGAEQIANGDDGLSVLADHFPDITLAELELEDGFLRALELREDHVIGEIDELAQHEIKKFLHGQRVVRGSARGVNGMQAGG